jgi:hypothetical protein
LVAFRLLNHLGEKEELQRILRNNYTRGQIDLFVEADRLYDFQRVIDWMKRGRHHALLKDNPDAIRDLGPARTQAAQRRPVLPDHYAVPRAQDELTLVSILGAAPRRVAQVNDTPLVAGDQAKVRVGTNLVAVRCLEVRADSVVLEVLAEGREVELRLPARPAE